jgi:23S rRNA (guanine2445-N2)-methyltransferase / 23S rRNA (guanine2069-N7)-methyltransferase
MFVNRLRKNLKHLKRQAEKQGLESYRVYDADLPEYAFAIDLNKDSARVKEYQAPKTVEKKKALQRQQEVLAVLPEVLELAPSQIFFSIEPRERKNKKS